MFVQKCFKNPRVYRSCIGDQLAAFVCVLTLGLLYAIQLECMLEPVTGTSARPAAAPLWKVGHSRQCGGVSPAPNVTALQRGGGPRPDTFSRGSASGSVGEHGRLRSVTIPLRVLQYNMFKTFVHGFLLRVSRQLYKA